MKRGIRKKEGEDLSSTKIEEVIALLSSENPITKKDACAMLNIAYNTTRLNRIIEEHNEHKEYRVQKRKELRSKPLSREDYAFIISSYLETGNISEIADITFRSAQVIKRALAKYNIPLRNSSTTYHNPVDLINATLSEDYSEGDLVYSARYDQAAYISKMIKEDTAGPIYRVWLTKDCQYAYQPFFELADLRALQTELGVKIVTRKFSEIDDEGNEPIVAVINQTLINARKRKKDE